MFIHVVYNKAHNDFSGNYARVLGEQNDPAGGTYYIDFEIDIEETGNYKLWMYGSDPEYGYCSPATLILDGTQTISDVSYGGRIWDCGNTNMPLIYRTADLELTAGMHTIRYSVNGRAPSASDWYRAVFDFMIIMPEDYIWTPSKTELPTAF